ncbi:MAG: hypothetical protein SNJ81_19740, partial [Cyanobacteriota bacterium]
MRQTRKSRRSHSDLVGGGLLQHGISTRDVYIQPKAPFPDARLVDAFSDQQRILQDWRSPFISQYQNPWAIAPRHPSEPPTADPSLSLLLASYPK